MEPLLSNHTHYLRNFISDSHKNGDLYTFVIWRNRHGKLEHRFLHRIQGKFNMFCNLNQICNKLKKVSRFYEGKNFQPCSTEQLLNTRYRPSKWLKWQNNVCQWWNTCKNSPETKLWIEKIRILGENGINSKLKHRNAHNSILSGRFGDLCRRPEDGVISGRLLNNLGELAYMYSWLKMYGTN